MYFCAHWCTDLMPVVVIENLKSAKDSCIFWEGAEKMGTYGRAFKCARLSDYDGLAQLLASLCHEPVSNPTVE